MRRWMWLSVIGLVIVIGLVMLVGAGVAVLTVAAVAPYVVIAFALREECNRAYSECVAEYLAARKHA